MLDYSILPLSVTSKDAFTEASREELRVLIALVEANGRVNDIKTLAKMASVSNPRATSALAFWEEASVISESDAPRTPTITEEFEERLTKGEIKERTADEVATLIRRDSLSEMIAECASLMGRSALNTAEIKDLTALYEQYSLSVEYIITLAAHLSTGGKLTVTRLVNKAIQLVEKEVETLETLESYIADIESTSETEHQLRSIFGWWNRALSKTEKDYFKKWSHDYGYFADIVGEAYDIACANATRGHAKYVDKLLTAWFEAGCRTLAECRKKYDADEAARREAKVAEKKSTKAKPAPTRYGEYEVEDAFMKALERSYGEK